MGINYYIIKNNTISGKTEVKYIEYTDVAMAISGGTFTGPISATTFSGNGSGLTGIPGSSDTFISGATFDNNTLILDDNNGGQLNAIITDLTGVTFDGFPAGDSRLKHWAEMYNENNTSTTTITSSGVGVKVDAITFLGGSRGFVMTGNNRLTYTAATTGQTFEITATISGEATSGSQSAQFSIYKNGTTEITPTITETEFTSSKRSLSLTGTLSIGENDFIELWAQNNTSNKNLEVQTFTVRIAQI